MTEVSDLSTDNAVTLAVPGATQTLTIPSISTRRAETTVEIPSGGSLALAGMIQEQTKQQINGVPGLMQLPILGSLFKSRDYINNQTELMVLVTPYIVRAVAQKQLSRPDDGFADPNDQSTALLGRLNRIYGAAGKSRAAAERIPRQIRIHSRLSGMGRRSMTDFLTTIAKRRGATALRALAVVGLATSLAGCYTQRVAQQEPYPDRLSRTPSDHAEGRRAHRRDFRRAAIAAGSRRASAPTCFRSRNCGGARPPAASSWTFRAAGRPTAPPPIRCARCNRFSPPPACRATPSTCAPIRPASFTLASIKINYAKVVAAAGPCGLWPHDLGASLDRSLHREPSVLESRLRQPAQSRRHGRQSRRSGAAARRSAGLCRRAARWRSTSTARVKIPSGTYTDYDKGKISDLGK